MDSRKSKKAKSEGSEDITIDEQLEAKHEKLRGIQDEIEKLNDEATEEILRIEKKFNTKRKPYYKKRNEIIREIPDFWQRAFMNHPILADLLDEEDLQVFKHLKELNVEDAEDIKSGFKITLTFETNPYFTNPTLSKQFQYDDQGLLRVTPSKIDWKEGMDLTKRTKGKGGNKRAQGEDSETFFNWFSVDDQDLELGEYIKEDIWPNPGKFYEGEIDDEEEEADELAEVDGDEDGEEEAEEEDAGEENEM